MRKCVYYVLDAQGNTLSTYEYANDDVNHILTYAQTEKHIYGSSRLGVNNEVVPLYGSQNATYSMKLVQHKIGQRTYELSNHLGNVLSIISDKVIPHNNAGSVDYYMADIRHSQDFSAFGVKLHNRNLSLSTTGNKPYSMGFQGQLEDAETGLVNFEYRMHDPRIGRFFVIDPLSYAYPFNSPYAFSENRVLDCIELEGLEAKKNVHYYNMVQQKDGTYKPVYNHSNSSLVIKATNAIFRNSVTKKESIVAKGEHGAQSQTSNVYTYWNADGTIQKQVVVSKDMNSQNSAQWEINFDAWNKKQQEQTWNDATPEQKAESENIQATLQPLRDAAIEMAKPVAALFEIEAMVGGSGMATGGPINGMVQEMRMASRANQIAEEVQTLGDLLEGAKAVKVKPNAPEQYFTKAGGYEEALGEFNSLGLKNVKRIDGKFEGFTGTLEDGTTVTVRNGSSGRVSGKSEVTLQFNPKTGPKTKIRYGN